MINLFPLDKILGYSLGNQGALWTNYLNGLRQILNLVLVVICCATLVIFSLALPSEAGAMDYNRGNLVGTDFSHQDLHGAIFDHSNLRGADFTGANLQGARFFSANMDGAILEGADARGADFESARLSNANLRNARLEGSFGTNTKFGEVDIEGADLTDIILRPDVEDYLCERAKGTNPETGRQTKDTLFCP